MYYIIIFIIIFMNIIKLNKYKDYYDNKNK